MHHPFIHGSLRPMNSALRSAAALRAGILPLLSLVSITACATVEPQPLSHFDETSSRPFVAGVAEHSPSLRGYGVTPATHAAEYNAAFAAAFASAPPGTARLANVTTSKVHSSMPPIIGGLIIAGGAGLGVVATSLESSESGSGLPFMFVGSALAIVGLVVATSVESYDFVVIGQPDPRHAGESCSGASDCAAGLKCYPGSDTQMYCGTGTK